MRKTTIIVAVIILLVIGYCAIYSKGRDPEVILNLSGEDPLQKEDFQIAGLKLGQSISEATKIYGKPIKRQKMKGNPDYEYYYYEGMEIQYCIPTSEIIWIETVKKGVRTPRGISIGDKEGRVIKYYGSTRKLNGNDLNYQEIFSKGYLDSVCAISFIVEKKRVIKIRVYYAAD